MVGWYHRLDGHEFKQAPRESERQESLACCSPWGHKESDVTEQLNNYSKGVPCQKGRQRPNIVIFDNKYHIIQWSDISSTSQLLI